MTEVDLSRLFSRGVLQDLFPNNRANDFFDALFGDHSEGSYDISLQFKSLDESAKVLNFELHLHERPGKCLACNLTYGLPEVFSRHPVINLKGLVGEIGRMIGDHYNCREWQLGSTKIISNDLHVIPLRIYLE